MTRADALGQLGSIGMPAGSMAEAGMRGSAWGDVLGGGRPGTTGIAGIASGNTAQRDFASVLARAGHPAQTGPGTSPEAEARESAEDLVAIGLVQPVLAAMRETSFAAAPFKPTSGEKQMRTVSDAVLARQMVRRTNWAVVERITEQMLRTAEDSDEAVASDASAGGALAPGAQTDGGGA